MRYFLFVIIILLAACTFTVRETRTEPERAATRTARALPALHEGRLRIVLDGPVPPIAPAVGVPDWTYVVTPQPTKASE
jgi:hypothetical protein